MSDLTKHLQPLSELLPVVPPKTGKARVLISAECLAAPKERKRMKDAELERKEHNKKERLRKKQEREESARSQKGTKCYQETGGCNTEKNDMEQARKGRAELPQRVTKLPLLLPLHQRTLNLVAQPRGVLHRAVRMFKVKVIMIVHSVMGFMMPEMV